MSMSPIDDWWLASEAAELTGYSLEHIRRLARAGRIKSQKFGRDWVIFRESLLYYMEHEGHGPEPKRKLDEL